MDTFQPRRKKTAAERRAQRLRSEGRVMQQIFKCLNEVSSHRGGELTRLGQIMVSTLKSGGDHLQPKTDVISSPSMENGDHAEQIVLQFPEFYWIELPVWQHAEISHPELHEQTVAPIRSILKHTKAADSVPYTYTASAMPCSVVSDAYATVTLAPLVVRGSSSSACGNPSGSRIAVSPERMHTEDGEIQYVYLGKTRAPSVKSFQALCKKFSKAQLRWMIGRCEHIFAQPKPLEPHLTWACGIAAVVNNSVGYIASANTRDAG